MNDLNYLDTGVALSKLRSHWRPGCRTSNGQFIDALFEEYLKSDDAKYRLYSQSQAGRWIRGHNRMPEITSWYLDNPKALEKTLEAAIIPDLDDPYMVREELLDAIWADNSINYGKQLELETIAETESMAHFFRHAILFVMNRKIVKKTGGTH